LTCGRKASGKRQADEQKSHSTADRGEMSWRNAARPSSPAAMGKCGPALAERRDVVEQRVLTWGDPEEEMPWEVSGGRSTETASRVCVIARLNEETGRLDAGKG